MSVWAFSVWIFLNKQDKSVKSSEGVLGQYQYFQSLQYQRQHNTTSTLKLGWTQKWHLLTTTNNSVISNNKQGYNYDINKNNNNNRNYSIKKWQLIFIDYNKTATKLRTSTTILKRGPTQKWKFPQLWGSLYWLCRLYWFISLLLL